MMKEIKQIKSFMKHLLVGFSISLTTIIIMKGLTYIGLPNNIASIISAISVLTIPISVGIFLFKDIKLLIKEIRHYGATTHN